jgi:hypothetical protein
VIRSQFSPARFSFIPEMSRAVDDVLDKEFGGQDVVVIDNVLVQRLVGHASIAALCGGDISREQREELFNVANLMVAGTDRVFVLGTFGFPRPLINLYSDWFVRPHWRTIAKILKPVFASARKELEDGVKKPSTFIEMMIDHHKEGITDEELGEYVSAVVKKKRKKRRKKTDKTINRFVDIRFVLDNSRHVGRVLDLAQLSARAAEASAS